MTKKKTKIETLIRFKLGRCRSTKLGRLTFMTFKKRMEVTVNAIYTQIHAITKNRRRKRGQAIFTKLSQNDVGLI